MQVTEQGEPLDILAELKSIGRRLRTQDNRATAEPIYLVEQRAREYGVDPAYTDTFIWLGEAASEPVDEEEARKLEAAFRSGEQVEGYRRVGYRERWDFVTVCLTEEAADAFIVANRHNLSDPRTYVASGWRNPEWKMVRAALLALSEG